MALRIQERGEVVKGVPVVEPGDDLFWFNRPRLILYLINFVLFQNAFQVGFFAWTWVCPSFNLVGSNPPLADIVYFGPLRIIVSLMILKRVFYGEVGTKQCVKKNTGLQGRWIVRSHIHTSP